MLRRPADRHASPVGFAGPVDPVDPVDLAAHVDHVDLAGRIGRARHLGAGSHPSPANQHVRAPAWRSVARVCSAVITGLLIASVLPACGLFNSDVPRKFHGRLVIGRAIAPEAYTAYFEGATAEARGDLDVALRSYRVAAIEDPASGDIWARIGAVQCALGQSPEAAFDKATDKEGDLASVWTTRALCHLDHGAPAKALEEATRAIALDPASTEVGLLYASTLMKNNRLAEAQIWLEGLLARDPSSESALVLLASVADSRGQTGVATRAHHQLAILAANRGLDPPPPQVDPSHSRTIEPTLLDDALRAGDLPNARMFALALRVTPEQLAVRALELGKYRQALEQATLVLGADPDSGDALVVTLVSADILGDERRVRWALSTAGARLRHPSEALRPPMEALLKRRAKLDAE